MIEYQYDFWLNYSPSNNPVLFFVLILPAFFLVLSVKRKSKKTFSLMLSVASAVLILGVYKYNIGNRFISYSPEDGVLKLVNGEEERIDLNEISQFWSVRLGRFGRHSCYIWIEGKSGKSFNSVRISNDSRRCAHDVKLLNEKLNQ